MNFSALPISSLNPINAHVTDSVVPHKRIGNGNSISKNLLNISKLGVCTVVGLFAISHLTQKEPINIVPSPLNPLLNHQILVNEVCPPAQNISFSLWNDFKVEKLLNFKVSQKISPRLPCLNNTVLDVATSFLKFNLPIVNFNTSNNLIFKPLTIKFLDKTDQTVQSIDSVSFSSLYSLLKWSGVTLAGAFVARSVAREAALHAALFMTRITCDFMFNV